MMKMRLNLATRPLESNRRFAVAAATVGGLGVLAMLILSWQAYAVWRSNKAIRAEQEQLESQVQALRAQQAELQAFFDQQDTQNQLDRASFLNSLIARRAFPWVKVFMDLERNLPEGVRVISIQPKLEEDHLELKLTIGALNNEQKVKFLDALGSSSEFSNIQVLDEAEPARPTDTDHVLLSLVAHYTGA